MKKFYPLYLLILLACNPKRIDTSLMVSEMKKTELKRITPTQISVFANGWGQEIVNALNTNKNEKAALEAQYNVIISNISLTKPVQKKLDKKETQILEAYQYNLKNNLPIPANLQALSGGEKFIFTAQNSLEKSSIWRIEFTKKKIIQNASVKEIRKMTTK